MKRNIIAILLLILLVFFRVKKICSQGPIELQGAVFGTSYTIIYYDQEINFDAQIQQYFAEINQSLSTYIPTSDISRINRGEEGIKSGWLFQRSFREICSNLQRNRWLF